MSIQRKEWFFSILYCAIVVFLKRKGSSSVQATAACAEHPSEDHEGKKAHRKNI